MPLPPWVTALKDRSLSGILLKRQTPAQKFDFSKKSNFFVDFRIGGQGMERFEDPHGEQPVLAAGSPPAEARAAMILVHGRGATAEGILSLVSEWDAPQVAFLAPQAAGASWYPYRFLAPTAQNEPYLSSALALLDRLFASLEVAGIASAQTVLLGFSQGACLALEYTARRPRRYGGIAGLSGGLIGPPGGLPVYAGDLAQTPVFLGCSELDPHIPLERVHETAVILGRMGAQVEQAIYPGLGHTIVRAELDAVQGMIERLSVLHRR